MRVATAFNRLLRLPGALVRDVGFAADGVIVTVALRRRRAACSTCGQVCRRVHDRARRRWRHLDLGGQRCFGLRVAPGALSGLRRARRGAALGPAGRSAHP